MADNTTLNVGTGGDTFASDDVGGIKYQRVKISVGADGSATDATTNDPLAVSIGPKAVSILIQILKELRATRIQMAEAMNVNYYETDHLTQSQKL
jgi:hypothetical protein